MLLPEITLAVDVLNNGTPVSQLFQSYDRYQNRSIYIGSGHNPLSRNTVTFYRSFPTRIGNFLGTAKSSVKFTRDISVPGANGSTTNTAPMIAEVNFAFPSGATAAQMREARQQLIALLDRDDIMVPLNEQLMV